MLKDFNQLAFVNGTRKMGEFFYRYSDLKMIDGFFCKWIGPSRTMGSTCFTRIADRIFISLCISDDIGFDGIFSLVFTD